ncbi:hypothetical protein [Streptomyces hydrogenans]|uniref:hypothetical protein n=1 Tax=Streptomyces hydrogenans TaxID=1873719 RepID=UPI0037F50879
MLAALGRHEEAVHQLDRVAEGRIRLLGPAHPWTVSAQELLREYRTPDPHPAGRYRRSGRPVPPYRRVTSARPVAAKCSR